ncbi:FtsX-like permease family protein [Streptococcus suis]|uniref:ABC superfamily ATP binding cassette transporter, membrane protein n=3 Tax=Streptococcus suis TaxID=1307 RepID=A0A0Z8TWB7_STRSU|nr:FtsX-like permease family protein [Streptococcus suis]AWL25155.1 ABC transporter permease [Streptococcus suis]NQG21720.1 FtsX-like permease family protein [Streptococcus suis]NQG44730.1 FtsX-like permease family protein [Streptococcus suis]NQH16146.1 FtsX-like permease family protein [Streptococcus suis]NQN13790.1 FtsX-like permease family protein [Streptococcus suis]
MVSKTYWKDIRQSFSSSKGRVVSIVSLMALGSFALIGLKVTAPDMRTTGEHFFEEHQVADLFVISDYGLSQSDQTLLSSLDDEATIEYGYFKDVVVTDSTVSFRVFSTPKELSTYEVVEGSLPSKTNEIALSAAYQGDYQIGDTITFDEKADADSQVLTQHTFTITGFVNSSELLSRVNLGQSTAGSGELNGYAVVPEATFDSDVYMIARIAYDDLAGLSPYEQTYLDKIYEDKKTVKELLADQPAIRLAEVKTDAQEQIAEGYDKIAEAKVELASAKSQLTDAQTQIADGESQLASGQAEIASAESQLTDAASQLASGQVTLDSSYAQLAEANNQLSAGWSQLSSSKATLDSAASQIAQAEQELASKKSELDSAAALLTAASQTIAENEATLTAAKSELDSKTAELTVAKSQLDQAAATIAVGQAELTTAKDALVTKIAQLQAAGIDPSTVAEVTAAQASITQKEAELRAAETSYQSKLADYQAAESLLAQKAAQYQAGVSQLDAAKTELTNKQAQYDAGLAQYNAAVATLNAKKAEYESGLSQYTSAYETLVSKQAQYDSGWSQYQSGLATLNSKEAEYQSGLVSLDEAKATLASKTAELEEAKATLASKQSEYDSKKSEADAEIAEKEVDLQEAQERVDNLALPTYAAYTRREIPGAEGYLSYENNASIIDSVGNIFPVVLYFIASLVTFTTMVRFVDEERLKAGTLRALGYDSKDIVRKFVIYGAVTGLVGTAIGTLLGHLLLPSIIYSTYSSKIVLAPIELHFYPFKTLLAVTLGLLSTVLPAILVARKELAEQPAQLLLPKPPVAGDKIFMERIKPLWSRMSFTQKVTARNIFRYKQRMLMTIFGVCGSIALLFAGLGVRSSIADLNNRQFTDIIKYDMIVASNSNLTTEEETALSEQLDSSAISQEMPVHYETVTKVAGSKKDEQSITLLAADSSQDEEFRDYINLVNRESQEDLSLSLDGAIISEKLATLLGVQVGDAITVQDSNDQDVTIRVAGITEMYMSHFIFMSSSYYEEVFGANPDENAHVIILKDNSVTNTNQVASDFMELDAVKGVVQNTILKEQVNTIVHSLLNRVMYILIITSVLLAIVILYNLTNINVAERIRELSTIKVLGFYSKEVTMYIYRESIYLSLIGILVGFVMGIGLHRYMISIIPPESIMFNPALGYLIYLVPAAVVIAILAVLGLVVNQWLKKVDMLEALKSVE